MSHARHHAARFAFAACLVAGACGGSSGTPDAAPGADAALADAAPAADARPDAAPLDAATADARPTDAAVVDASLVDASLPDARVVDASLLDASRPDAFVADAASFETCGDHVDNDGDHAIDCASWACLATTACGASEICGNGLDDDDDGYVDGADADCPGFGPTCPDGQPALHLVASDLPKTFAYDPVACAAVTGTESTVSVATTGTVTRLAVGVQVSHPSQLDLNVFLRSPGGRETQFFLPDGSHFHAMDDSATETSALSVPPPPAPAGAWRHPYQQLSSFIGAPSAGVWKLRVSDCTDDGNPANNMGTILRLELWLCVAP